MSNLDPDVKVKWLAALRSGEYQQGRDMLRDPATGALCCIGVLGAIQGEPLAGMNKMGLCGLGGGPRQAGMHMNDLAELAQKNDAGWSFDEIADYIDKRF